MKEDQKKLTMEFQFFFKFKFIGIVDIENNILLNNSVLILNK